MIRFPKRKKSGIAIQLTALIDMVFLLLIYFLLTSNFVEQEGITISVPKVRESGLYEEGALLVVIDGAGQYYLEQKPIADQDLWRNLSFRLAHAADKSVVIKADRQVAYDRVAQALDIAKAGGAEELNLAVEKIVPVP